MGEEVDAKGFTREDRRRYRDKVRRSLDVFARLLAEARFDAERRSFGLEIELNLTDERGDPAPHNAAVLESIADADFQTELARFNVEINVPPRLLGGTVLTELERDVRASLNRAEDRSHAAGAYMMLVGILPTVMAEHLDEGSISANPRYRLLNEAIFAARGEDLELSIHGAERLEAVADTIAPEAACTSVQLHGQVEPEGYAVRRVRSRRWRPRVWFGERWITSIFDLFEENVRYFPALLPMCDEEDPEEVLAAGGVPKLGELRLHSGTVYRWNRPVYDVSDGRPHLRVENRVLPAGPTVVDIVANAAFYYGLVEVLCRQERPIWSQMSFAAAEENFHAGARDGIDARLYWPGVGEVPATELVLRRLLPMAHEGLEVLGIDAGDRDRLLGIVEQRCLTARNGSTWQVETFHRLHDGRGLERREALRAMTLRYRELMHSNEPVHTWPLE